jgi:hypothetical protein
MNMKTKPKGDFYKAIDSFVEGLYKDGTVKRWEHDRKMAVVERNRRRMNRKIKEEKIIMECLKEKT